MRSAEDLGGGWVPIERRLLSPGHDLHPRQQGEEVSKAFARIDLWALAVWDELGDLKPGELKASQRELANRWDWDRSRVRRFLNRLEERGEIERESRSGAQADLIRIVRYPEVHPNLRGTAERRGTDPPGAPHQRPTKRTEDSGRSPVDRPTPVTNNRPPHHSEEEQNKRAHAREEKRNGEQTATQDRVRKVWEEIETARDEGCLDDLDLPATETKALERIGGREALDKASGHRSRLVQLKNEFFLAVRELLGGQST